MFAEKWKTRLSTLRRRLDSDAPSDDELDHLRSWSISAQLAALPPEYLQQVPQEVAALIRAAKDLHPRMADVATERARRDEPCPRPG